MTPDVVIVGGGSAGCLLANRLSADPDRRVLLIEAGEDVAAGDQPAGVRGLNPFVLQRPEFAPFRYDDIMACRTTAQAASPYLRGRGIGGSTLINGHLAIRGEAPDEFAAWGLPGWSDAEVMDAFRAVENDLDFPDDPGHGSAGPMPVSRAPQERWSRLDRAFRDAALAAGHPWTPDHNTVGTTGVSPYASVLRGDRRVTAAEAYLDPARDRPNLEVRPGAVVDRVLLDGERAVGVLLADGTEIAAGEVVLAAGAVHSPAILLRTGIGPAAHLGELGVPLRRDAPVGANLQDHSAVWLGIVAAPEPAAPEPRFASCCVRWSSGLPGTATNDMFFSGVNLTAVPELGLAGLLNVCTYQAFSRGELRLASLDPRVSPVLDMRMVSDQRDVVRLRDGVRALWALIQSPPLREVVAGVVVPATGAVLDALPADDAALDAFVAAVAQDAAHVAGTCRMGAPDDPRSVVDPTGALIGLTGLRVIDASLFPEIPRANTQLPTLMLAERLSRLFDRPGRRVVRAGAPSARS